MVDVLMGFGIGCVSVGVVFDFVWIVGEFIVIDVMVVIFFICLIVIDVIEILFGVEVLCEFFNVRVVGSYWFGCFVWCFVFFFEFGVVVGIDVGDMYIVVMVVDFFDCMFVYYCVEVD